MRARLALMEEPTVAEAEDGWWHHKLAHRDSDNGSGGDDHGHDGETVGVVVPVMAEMVVVVRAEMVVVGMMAVLLGVGMG